MVSNNIIITEDSSRKLENLVKLINYTQTKHEQDEFSICQIQKLTEKTPFEILNSVLRFKESKSEPWLRLDGMPKTKHSEVLLLIASLLGNPFAHEQEAELVCSVKPKKEAIGTSQTAFFTWNKFDLHTELPYHTMPPDYLILYCVENVPGGITLTSSALNALEHLDKKDRSLLQEEAFKIAIPPHFRHSNSHSTERPIIYKNGSVLERIRVRFDGIECCTNRHEKALMQLKTQLEKGRVEHHLNPGDMLIINNRLSVHGRTAFNPRFDNKDRELKRVYVIEDLASVKQWYVKNRRRVLGF
ncbi:TauD/TfdA family dioxygenase [Aeromonas dhakensis]|uniref:TauD/TfdA family dioxygenase n=1 Tax=Aeromonas dhakensis TaxID=196024 RepID=UPI0021585871|nr:TauD/TfdA family dioxygenase [Aeromonas dhakensis]MCR6741678.1 TauD/TfdA family dioxygenase [Aeromonas dhakensis]